MWALRVLNGPQSGQIYFLKNGKNRIGRSAAVDFQLNSTGVSKEHLELQVVGDRIVIRDLNSSNGTFVNGVKIQTSALRKGDKIGVNNIIFDVISADGLQSANGHQMQTLGHGDTAVQTYAGQAPQGFVGQGPQAFTAQGPQTFTAQGPQPASPVSMHNLQQKIDDYLSTVVMPSLYRLVEVFEFRLVIMGFAILFIFMVTLLSVIPMNQITSESIKIESRRRALTVARALANSNEKAIRSGEITGYSADLVLRDEGIANVYILAKDGSIMAPPEMAGMSPKGDVAGFAAQIKGQIREVSGELGQGRIAASCPILIFDPELQQNVAKAYAVVIYDTGSMKFDDGRALSLFIQMLVIALILGTGLFYLMYKLIEYPFLRLDQELDTALREGRDHAVVELKFPLLQKVLVGINSLLTRAQAGSSQQPNQGAGLRDQEWMNMIQLVGYPALLLSKEMVVVSINAPFEALTGINGSSLQGQPLQYLPDQAMQKNIEELMRQSNANTSQVQTDRLDINGNIYRLQCQAMTVAGDAKFFLITISANEDAQGGAA